MSDEKRHDRTRARHGRPREIEQRAVVLCYHQIFDLLYQDLLGLLLKAGPAEEGEELVNGEIGRVLGVVEENAVTDVAHVPVETLFYHFKETWFDPFHRRIVRVSRADVHKAAEGNKGRKIGNTNGRRLVLAVVLVWASDPYLGVGEMFVVSNSSVFTLTELEVHYIVGAPQVLPDDTNELGVFDEPQNSGSKARHVTNHLATTELFDARNRTSGDGRKC